MVTRPTHTFHIRPERGSRLAVRVEVFATVQAFRQAAKAEALAYGMRRYRTRGLVGECVGVTERLRKSRRKTGLFAVLRFPREELTMSTITHEAFHATMRWAARRKIAAIPTSGGVSNITAKIPTASIEERAATVHDTLCRRIVREAQRRGLLPE